MSKHSEYENVKYLTINAKIDIAKSNTISDEERFQYYINLSEEFDKVSFDSTLYYLDKSIRLANKLNNKVLIDQARLYLCRTLGNVGRSKEAEDILKKLIRITLPRRSSSNIAWWLKNCMKT